MGQRRKIAVWLVRTALLIVLAWNLSAALPFLLAPGRYAPAFELSGVQGDVMVRGTGLLFLMWNLTFLPPLLDPVRHRATLTVVVLQQLVGLGGEGWMLLTLPAGHPALQSTGLRFVAFDSAGLVLLVAGLACVGWISRGRRQRSTPP